MKKFKKIFLILSILLLAIFYRANFYSKYLASDKSFKNKSTYKDKQVDYSRNRDLKVKDKDVDNNYISVDDNLENSAAKDIIDSIFDNDDSKNNSSLENDDSNDIDTIFIDEDDKIDN